MMETLLVLSNAPDAATARQLAETLVTERLAACVNLLPPCESIYRWQGRVEQASETPLLIKTTPAAWPALAARLAELHPYEVPEILAVPVTAGFGPYLSWVASETISSTPTE